MHKEQEFTIDFGDISIRFSFPIKIEIPKEFKEFLIEGEKKADAEYEIRLLDQPLHLSTAPIGSYSGMKVYRTEEGLLRNYTPLTAEDKCQLACLLRKDQKNILYYPASKWDFYSEELHLLHLIGIEEVLIEKNALLLHSSVVKINGYTILFSGPSGIGKSTQAKLWETHLGAKVLNGDRCVVRKKDNQFWGCGSPWCGTSGVYSKEQAPIKGIFILKQAATNSVRRLGAEAFKELYSQCIVNTWDRGFIEKTSDLLTGLLNSCPIYELACCPDAKSVELAYHALFEGGIPDGNKDQCSD